MIEIALVSVGFALITCLVSIHALRSSLKTIERLYDEERRRSDSILRRIRVIDSEPQMVSDMIPMEKPPWMSDKRMAEIAEKRNQNKGA